MRRVASDGLPARVSGPWTREKLIYVSKYAGAFMTSMAPKRTAQKWVEFVYIDPSFDRLFFSDLSNRNVDALRRRISPSDLNRVTLQSGDWNEVGKGGVKALATRSLGLAFIDPEGFEVAFSLFEILSTRRIDVLFLFPSGIGIRRNLAKFARRAHSPMDRLWGDCSWRELPPAKLAAGRRLDSDEALSLDRPWVLAFRTKMAGLGFIYQDEADPCFTNEKNVPMYHLLFFSKHPAGLTLWRGIKKISPSGQRLLPF